MLHNVAYVLLPAGAVHASSNLPIYLSRVRDTPPPVLAGQVQLHDGVGLTTCRVGCGRDANKTDAPL